MVFQTNIYNNKGDEVLDFNPAYYLKFRGMTTPVTTIQNQALTKAINDGRSDTPTNHSRTATQFFRIASENYYTSISGEFYSFNSFAFLTHPKLHALPGDLIFVLPKTIGFFNFTMFNVDSTRTTDLPHGSTAEISSVAPLDFIVLSTNPSGLVASGTYGVQVRRPPGVVVYDSRFPQASVFHAEKVSASILNDILLNNTVYDITLPKAVAECWISIPYHTSFRGYQNPTTFALTYYNVNITQTSPTNIRLSRRGTVSGNFVRGSNADMILIFARIPN